MNAIEVHNVLKVFRIPSERRSTLKEHAVGLFRRVHYNEFSALNDVSFSVRKGEFFGIIGRNGSGKSTLLKIIAGIFVPSSGTVKVNGKVSSFLELGVGFNPDLTARENIFLYGAILGLSREEINAKFDSIIQFAELENFVDAKLKTFSSGMQVRLGFATAIQADADIYLVDEVLAVGDANFQQKCFDTFERFKREGKTVVFVSHDLNAIKKFCTKAIFINSGKKIIEGKPEKTISEYAEERHESNQKQGRAGENAEKKIEITSIKITDRNKKKTNTFSSGDEINVEIEYVAHETIKNPWFRVQIFSDTGTFINGTNTDRFNIRLGSVKGKGNINLQYKELNILEGTYFISGGILKEKSYIEYDQKKTDSPLRIKSLEEDGAGIARIKQKWSISKR